MSLMAIFGESSPAGPPIQPATNKTLANLLCMVAYSSVIRLRVQKWYRAVGGQKAPAGAEHLGLPLVGEPSRDWLTKLR